MSPALPAWAAWNQASSANPWTLGVEEEIMLLDQDSLALSHRNDAVLTATSDELAGRIAAETHGCAIELSTRPHSTARAATRELAEMRGVLAARLRQLGLRPAVAGTHPFAMGTSTEVSPGARYQAIHDSMRALARREPTFALHVHVAVPDPETATNALGRMRVHLPLLLALAANSPFWRGHDSGMASARTPVFSAFPRVGIPRLFEDYAGYVETIDSMLRLNAFPEPTFVWWDVRLQPRFGTIEVRIMDAQTRVEHNAGLAALVQCLVRLESLGELASPELSQMQEVLAENRFIASRDGMDARFLDPVAGCARPARDLAEEILSACEPHAEALECTAELRTVEKLVHDPGYARQRAFVAAHPSSAQAAHPLVPMVEALSDAFCADATLAA